MSKLLVGEETALQQEADNRKCEVIMRKEKEKVYIYTRVSTTMQIDGYSLDAQKARMKAFADFNNYAR